MNKTPLHYPRCTDYSTIILLCMIGISGLLWSPSTLAQTQISPISNTANSPILTCEAAIQSPKLIDAPNQELVADTAITTEDGWTHFYHCTEEKLLLSIYTQDLHEVIGTIDAGLTVKSGTTANYGTTGMDLSAASYIDNELWFSANRYWSISELAMPADSLQIRFYIDSTDYQDLVNSFIDLPGEINNMEQMNPFAITGQADNPYLLNLNGGLNETIIYGHNTTLEERKDWIDGMFSDLYYSEFVVKNAFLPAFSEVSGSVGFLFFLPDTPLSISGQVLDIHEEAVEGVEVSCGIISASSNSFGQYQCTGLDNGADISITAAKSDMAAADVTVLDLNRMWTHILGLPAFASPYPIIAADVDASMDITAADETLLHNLILKKENELANVPTWRFVPTTYEFPNPLVPFMPPFPEQINLENILFDVFNQDFVGIKAGDVANEADYPNLPPLIVTPAFILSDHEVNCGDDDILTTILTVQDFTNLTGFQFSLAWDTARLELMGVDGFNLVNFSTDNLNLNLSENGRLPFAWTSLPTALEGVSKTDGEAICQLHFRLKSTHAGSTSINFGMNPTPIQVLRQNWSIVETPLFSTGQIEIMGSTVEAMITNVESVTCFGENDGAIDLTVEAGIPPFSYQWSNGATTEDISELSAGQYHVTIEDAGNCPFVLNNLQVNQPEELILSSDIDRPTCDDANSGMISVMPTGGTMPYNYEWEDGSDLSFLTNLSGGTYGLTITDAAACQTEEAFVVPDGGMLTASVLIEGVSEVDAENGRICITQVFFGTSPYTYQWSNGTSTACNENLGLGNYQLTITDANGCINQFAYEISCCVITATDEVNTGVPILNLYPNPVQTDQNIYLHIKPTLAQQVHIRLLDLSGRNVFQTEVSVFNETNITLPSPVIKGVYAIEVWSELGWRKVEKIVVW